MSTLPLPSPNADLHCWRAIGAGGLQFVACNQALKHLGRVPGGRVGLLSRDHHSMPADSVELYSPVNAFSAARIVSSTTSSECAVEMNPASNCDGAR